MILKTLNLNKIYGIGENQVHAVKNLNLEVSKGEILSITGSSGSGKSSLLHMLGGLDTPTEGEIIVNNKQINNLNDNELSRYRRTEIGFIFQFYNLIPALSAKENIMLPLLLDKKSVNSDYADTLLEFLGIYDRRDHYPEALSGGQQQRVAIARALISHPSLILADEPTGNLDSRNSDEIVKGLYRSVREFDQTLIMITHDKNIADTAQRTIKIEDGEIVDDRRNHS